MESLEDAQYYLITESPLPHVVLTDGINNYQVGKHEPGEISGVYYCQGGREETFYEFSRSRDSGICFYLSKTFIREVKPPPIKNYMRKTTEIEIIGNSFGLL